MTAAKPETASKYGRVLCVTSNFPRWNGDSTTPFVLHLCQDLRDLGWRIDVVAPHATGCASREVLGGVAVERFRYLWPAALETVCYQGGALGNLQRSPSNYVKLPPLIFFEWAAILRRLISGRYDLLHSHWILPQGLTGVLAAKPLGIPHVVTVHGSDVFALKGALMSRFKRFTLRRADAITVNSSATHAAVEKLVPVGAPVHTIPMGATEPKIDRQAVERIRGLYRRENGPLLVFVGRLVYEKGIDDLIEAVARLRDELPHLTALIIGDGPDRSGLEESASRLGVGDRTVFAGWVQPDQISNHLAAGDIFAGPSKKSPNGWIEAQGLTFVEAMLAGTPVIATRSGGIVDAVRHEETGLLVPESSPGDIAAAIRRLNQDAVLRNRLSTDAYSYARAKFMRTVSAQAFSDLYCQNLM